MISCWSLGTHRSLAYFVLNCSPCFLPVFKDEHSASTQFAVFFLQQPSLFSSLPLSLLWRTGALLSKHLYTTAHFTLIPLHSSLITFLLLPLFFCLAFPLFFIFYFFVFPTPSISTFFCFLSVASYPEPLFHTSNPSRQPKACLWHEIADPGEGEVSGHHSVLSYYLNILLVGLFSRDSAKMALKRTETHFTHIGDPSLTSRFYCK